MLGAIGIHVGCLVIGPACIGIRRFLFRARGFVPDMCVGEWIPDARDVASLIMQWVNLGLPSSHWDNGS